MTEQGSQFSELDSYIRYQGYVDTLEWMERYGTGNQAQRDRFKLERIDPAVIKLCDEFGLVAPADYPMVSDGQTRPLAPDGRRYFDDWLESMRQSLVSANPPRP